jgi:hypothetical protein
VAFSIQKAVFYSKFVLLLCNITTVLFKGFAHKTGCGREHVSYLNNEIFPVQTFQYENAEVVL